MSADRVKKLSSLIFLTAILISSTIAITSGSNGSGADPTYKGAEYCGLCHEAEYENWNQTNHAHATMLIQNATGNFYSIGSTNNLAGTPDRIYSEIGFANGSCRNCHVTGGNDFDPLGANNTWPERETDPGKFLNIQCEVCHGPFQADHWKPTGVDMLINYSARQCELCHTGSHDFSHSLSAHNDSLSDLLASGHASEYCLHCMTAQGSIGLAVTLETPDLESISCITCHDPHSHTYDAQLREEDSTELCGTCHGQDDMFLDSAHDLAGLECASCHGQGTHYAHGSVSALINHTWAVSGVTYPYNQTAAEEPVVCSSCHTQEWATTQLETIQNLVTKTLTNGTSIIDNANSAIAQANATSGVDQTKLNQAASLLEEASEKLDDVESDGSTGFHNPEGSYALISDAMVLASEAEALALEALYEAQVTALQTGATSMRNITIGGIVGALIVGLAIGFVVKRR